MPETKFKRKKNTRYRGSKTHGGGSMKKRRGAGHRGGRGNAGSGKRGDAKKPTFLKAKRRFGRFGFNNPTSKNYSTTNVGDLQAKLSNQLTKKIIAPQDTYEIDLTTMKIDKLLGNGEVKDKFIITVQRATPSAIAKIEAAGGKVTLVAPSQESSGDESSKA